MTRKELQNISDVALHGNWKTSRGVPTHGALPPKHAADAVLPAGGYSGMLGARPFTSAERPKHPVLLAAGGLDPGGPGWESDLGFADPYAGATIFPANVIGAPLDVGGDPRPAAEIMYEYGVLVPKGWHCWGSKLRFTAEGYYYTPLTETNDLGWRWRVDPVPEGNKGAYSLKATTFVVQPDLLFPDITHDSTGRAFTIEIESTAQGKEDQFWSLRQVTGGAGADFVVNQNFSFKDYDHMNNNARMRWTTEAVSVGSTGNRISVWSYQMWYLPGGAVQ